MSLKVLPQKFGPIGFGFVPKTMVGFMKVTWTCITWVQKIKVSIGC
jgi:hypothetical protein